MTHSEFGAIADPQEAQQLGAILQQCFGFSISSWAYYSNLLGLENYRVLRQRRQVVGGLGIYRMGQWFGGESIPIGGIAAVGVAPEHRGTGVAAELMRQTLRQLRADGTPLSTLYAATQRLYRKVGYEQAGSACRFSLPTQSLVPAQRLPIWPLNLADHKPFDKLYRQRAEKTNGNLDRNQAIWQRLLQPLEQVVYAYGIGPEDQPEGYVVFDQKPGATGYSLQVRDLVILTPRAGRALWTFFADHRSLASEVVWKGPTGEPLLALLSEQTYQVVELERWLIRIVDLPKALILRGYPTGLETELHLQVEDDLLPENTGRFVLAVSRGRGEVRPGGRGELRLNIQGLGPLYTGLFTPYQLQAIAELEATPAALATAAQIFAGPEPWMPDFF